MEGRCMEGRNNLRSRSSPSIWRQDFSSPVPLRVYFLISASQGRGDYSLRISMGSENSNSEACIFLTRTSSAGNTNRKQNSGFLPGPSLFLK